MVAAMKNNKERILEDILKRCKDLIDSSPESEEIYGRMRADGPGKVAKVLAQAFIQHYDAKCRKESISEKEMNELLNELITGKHNQRIAEWLGMQ